jgi:hypothetical protein
LAARVALAASSLCLLTLAALCYTACRIAQREAGRAIRIRLQMVREARRREVLDWYEKQIVSLSELATGGDVRALYARLKEFARQKRVQPDGAFPVKDPAYAAIWRSGAALQNFVSMGGHRDLYFIDAKTGQVLYSEENDTDNGVNLNSAEYRDSAIAGVWRASVHAAAQRYNDSVLDGLILSDICDYGTGLPFVSRATPWMNQFLALPMWHERPPKAVLVAQLEVQQLFSLLKRNSGLPRGALTYLVGKDGLRRSGDAVSGDRPVLTEKMPPLPAAWAFEEWYGEETEHENAGVVAVKRGSGHDVLAAYCTVFPEYPPSGLEHALGWPSALWEENRYRFNLPQWALVVEVPLAQAYAPARRLTALLIAVTAGLLWLGWLGAWRLGWRLEREVEQRAAVLAAEAMEDGALGGAPAGVEGREEG